MENKAHTKRYEQIADDLRRRVLAGLEEDRQVELPTQRELSRDLAVSVNTVRAALSLLEDEGVITTRHGSGSRLSEKLLAGKKTIAVVVGHMNYAQRLSIWHPLALGELCRFLEEGGWRVRLYTLFHGTPARDERVMDQLLADAVARKFAGVVCFPHTSNLREGFTELLRRQGICFIDFDQSANHNNIVTDYHSFGMLGVEHLRSRGVTRVGMISLGIASNSQEKLQPYADLIGARQAVANHLGMEMRPEWCVPTEPSIGAGAAAFKQIWGQKARPEGIIVSDEIVFYGVNFGMQELEVRHPQDLELVVQLTEGMVEDTPYKPPRLVFSPRMVARQAFNTISGMIRDRIEEVPTVRVSPKLVVPAPVAAVAANRVVHASLPREPETRKTARYTPA